MLSAITIKNFKSIVDVTIELGRFNVFIGENGCGKSNILEALALTALAAEDRTTPDDLRNRGCRVVHPWRTPSSFRDAPLPGHVEFEVEHRDPSWTARFRGHHGNAISTNWVFPEAPDDGLARKAARGSIGGFVIYAPNTLALRGLIPPVSLRTPGIHGDGVDQAIASLSDDDRELLVRHLHAIEWFDDVLVDDDDRLKLQGYKLGRSESRLYFRDRFMHEENNLFSAENANEGVLYLLFHLALFVSPETPKVFGVDDLETSLNPRLCRVLTKELVVLAKARDKQALVTTHNPAVLDGLNLHDDDQRLFVVSRNDEGHTQVKRIRVKPQPEEGARYMLSELWMRGHLGGIPKHF